MSKETLIAMHCIHLDGRVIQPGEEFFADAELAELLVNPASPGSVPAARLSDKPKAKAKVATPTEDDEKSDLGAEADEAKKLAEAEAAEAAKAAKEAEKAAKAAAKKAKADSELGAMLGKK